MMTSSIPPSQLTPTTRATTMSTITIIKVATHSSSRSNTKTPQRTLLQTPGSTSPRSLSTVKSNNPKKVLRQTTQLRRITLPTLVIFRIITTAVRKNSNDQITIEEAEPKLSSRSSRQWVKLQNSKETMTMRYTCQLSMLQELEVLREVLKVPATTTPRQEISRSIIIMLTLGQTTGMEVRDLTRVKPATQMALTQTVEVVPSARTIRAVAATMVSVATNQCSVVAPLRSSNHPRNWCNSKAMRPKIVSEYIRDETNKMAYRTITWVRRSNYCAAAVLFEKHERASSSR